MSGATADRSTQMAGAAAADVLLEPWFACLRERLPGLRVFDCHTHLGLDPDGSCQTAEELRDALDVVDGRAVTFSLSEPDGYRAANDRMLAAAEASGGRVVAFCRLAPNAGGLAEARRSLDRGAAGIKLHPRAERFSLSDTAVDQIAALAAARRAPIIVHAGRGIPSLGPRRARPRRPPPRCADHPRARRDLRPGMGSGARPRNAAACSSTPPGGTRPTSSHCSH